MGWEWKRIYNDGKLRIKMKMNLCVLCNHGAPGDGFATSPTFPLFVFFFNFFIFFAPGQMSRVTKQSPIASRAPWQIPSTT